MPARLCNRLFYGVKKGATIVLSITSWNDDRFSKFFHSDSALSLWNNGSLVKSHRKCEATLSCEIVSKLRSLTQAMLINDWCYQQIFTYDIKEINKSMNIQSVLLWPEHTHGDVCATGQLASPITPCSVPFHTSIISCLKSSTFCTLV